MYQVEQPLASRIGTMNALFLFGNTHADRETASSGPRHQWLCPSWERSPSDLNELRSGLDQVSQQRGTLGVALASLQQSGAYAASDEANLKAAQSSLVAADTTEVATDLSSNEVQQKALLSVMASTGSTTLFDYLK